MTITVIQPPFIVPYRGRGFSQPIKAAVHFKDMDPDTVTQIGGRLIGKGAYGCVFDPAPRCAGSSVFKKPDGHVVGKITVDDTNEELGIGKQIMALPLASSYYALPTVGCRPDTITDPDAKSCAVITDANEYTRLSLLLMPAAGQQLLRWGMNLQRMADSYVKMFVHLLEGMIIYQRAGYVHNDIHDANILVDTMGVARYIDFGMAFRPEDVKTWGDANLGRSFRPKYIWQPPELQAWRMYLNSITTEAGVERLMQVSDDYKDLQRRFNRSALAELSRFINEDQYVRADDFGGFVRAYGFRFDAWRLGLTMFMMWEKLQFLPGFKDSDLYKHYNENIKRILSGLTEFDPRRRITASAALRLLDPSNRMA
jgi:hypothetical protein